MSTAITDLAGNALASDYSWSFTTWVDTDDDGNDDDLNIPDDKGLGNYLWIILILIIAAVLGAIFLLARKQKPELEEEPTLEPEKCPKCGFYKEKGSECQACFGEGFPAPSEPSSPEPMPEEPATKSPEPKPETPNSKFTNEEMLEKIEKSYKDGKLTEEQYLKNKKKFS